MTRTWTDAQIRWLRENYRFGTIDYTVEAFEREFGRRPTAHALQVKAHRMGLKKDTHGEGRHQRVQKTMRWSSPELAREREWMLEHDNDESVFAVIDAFEAEFGIRLTRSQVSLFRALHGGKKRASHGGGKPNKPVGSERLGKDGYIMVKVREWPTKPQSKDNWKFKHHVVWEQANGRPVPEGCIVFFADKDNRNFDPDNLVALPRKYMAQLNNPELPDYNDRDTLLACVALCDLRSAMRDRLLDGTRICEVCGRPFKMTAAQREYPKPPRTCPDCLAAGKKARGERKPHGTARCAVCGGTFTKRREDQRRCEDCISRRPKHSASKQREAEHLPDVDAEC